MRVTVIGGGIIGLTTALALREAGHEVAVVAADTSARITSFAAGAVWFPFHAEPPERVNRWALRTREWLTPIAREAPEAGVDVLTLFSYVADESPPVWLPSAPDAELTHDGLPGREGAPRRGELAWRAAAPRVEPGLFMPWLHARLSSRGVTIERRRVESLRDVPGDAVVNCTGLEARALTGDPELRARYGGIVVTEPGDIDMRISISDERRPGELFYSIPRRREVILGGSAEDVPDSHGAGISPELTEAILERARLAGLRPGPVLRAYGGLRPFRTAVRLERDREDPRIIHHYGHGGAGFTICRGCALDVVDLVGRPA